MTVAMKNFRSIFSEKFADKSNDCAKYDPHYCTDQNEFDKIHVL